MKISRKLIFGFAAIIIIFSGGMLLSLSFTSNAASETNVGDISDLKNILIIIFIGSIATAIVIEMILFRAIVPPITQLIEMSSEISKGNLHTRTDIETDDEIGQLAKTMNFAIESMQEAKLRKDEYGAMLLCLLRHTF